MKFSEFIKKRWIIVLVALLVVAGGVALAISLLGQNETAINEEDITEEEEDIPKERVRLDLSALLSDLTGVKTESGFLLSIPENVKLDEKILMQGLKITPSLDYHLETAEHGMIIKPKSPLQENTVYTFKLDLPKENIKESWAFQTRRDFKIISSLPANQRTNVPVDSGIEITFSHSGIEGFEKNFSIEPHVEGRFEIHKNIAVFVPSSLKPDTIYKVTVGKGVSQTDSKETLKQEFSFSFQTAPINPVKTDSPYIAMYNLLNNFPTDIQPVIGVGTSGDMRGRDLNVLIYQYQDVDRFISDYDRISGKPVWASLNKADYLPDRSGLTLFKEYILPLASTNENDYMSYLPLPESLPEGHYLIIAESGESRDFSFIQVNNLQLYLSAFEQNAILWANDLITGKPASGVRFEGNGIQPVTTGADGTSLIAEDIYKSKDERSICFKASREGHPVLVAPVYYYNYYNYGYEAERSKAYWTNLYLDRSHYLPEDTVKIWGFMKPRNGSSSPEKALVQVVRNIYNPTTYGYEKHVLDTREVAISGRGTYSAEFRLDSLPEGTYRIDVVNGAETVDYEYFFVNRYKKSQYVVSIDGLHKSYFTGERFNADIGCEFFEGTPVSGYELKYNIIDYSEYRNLNAGELKIDNQGHASINYTIVEKNEPVSWRPIYARVTVSNKNPEETEIFETGYFYIFPRDVMTEVKAESDKGKVNLEFTLNRIDIEPIRNTESMYTEEGEPRYKGNTYDTTINASVYERYWDRRETGEYYDIISKRTVKTYDYYEVKNKLGTFQVQTNKGKADYTVSIPDFSPEKYYYIEYETLDTRGRPIKETQFIAGYEDFWYGYNYGYDYYHLEFADKDMQYKAGEAIEFSLVKNSNESISSGTTLYLVMQEGIKDYWTSNNSRQKIPFKEGYIPNAYIMAAHFDGRQIHLAYDRAITYDYGEEKLELVIETDKESYQPGETVNGTLTVKDSTGRPVEADVNISVVDEVYFALYQQEADALASLYKPVYNSGIITTYISYSVDAHGPGGAEGAEGGDEGTISVRRKFVDNAYFEATETNSRGIAKFSFKLPDNLTSWRFTCQAITGDLRAGSKRLNITTGLPFFVKAAMNDVYMVGDAPVLLLTGYGRGVDENASIDFKVTLVGPGGVSSSFETSGQVGNYAELSLPSLQEGICKVIVEGRCGSYKDAFEKTFQVRKSLLLSKQVDYHTLTKDLKLDGVESYAVLTFYNAELNEYYRALTDLYWSWGNRLDQVVAGNVSRELLSEYFPGDYYNYGDKIDISSYQQADGGLALLPYASSDVELSAKIAALCSQEIDTSRLTDYFRGIAEDPASIPLQLSAAYWGMAALREPVLLELQSMILEEITLDEKLYLANALAELGDFKTARKAYDQINEAFAKEIAPYRYIDNNGDKDDILRWTSLMNMLSVKIEAENSMSWFKYIEDNNPDKVLINLERLILVKQGIPYVSKKSAFTYELEGKKEKVELEGILSKTLFLSPDKLKTLKFSDISGDVALSVSYEREQDPGSNTNPIASISRSYNNTSGTVTLNRNDLVRIELNVSFSKEAPEGFYEIVDVLPSGLHYIYPYQAQVDKWYFGEPDGQLVKLGVYYDGKNNARKIEYNARVSQVGQYTADYAMIKHRESDAGGYTGRASIQIR